MMTKRKTLLYFVLTFIFTCLVFDKIHIWTLGFRLVNVRTYTLDIPYILQNRNRTDGNINFQNIKNNIKIDCKSIFQSDRAATKEASALARIAKAEYRTNEEQYISMTKNCTNFVKTRGYVSEPITEEEELFPIAYSILVYRDIDQFERLLRLIYRPQNVYCIHADLKSSNIFRTAVRSIIKCFDNVVITTKSISVSWGTNTLLMADILCMQETWNTGRNWKYYINLAGSEFPLRTNLELVKILKIFNGFNEVEGKTKRADKSRWMNMEEYMPTGVTPTKGNLHVAVNRQFVEYILTNKTAEKILLWTLDTAYPEETFYSTLNHNPQLGIPGSYKGDPEVKLYLSRYVIWFSVPPEEECYGTFIHHVCVFDVGDLSTLQSRPEFFANKFNIGNSFAFDCMEEMILNRTKEEILGTSKFNTSFYERFMSSLSQNVVW